MQRYLMLPAVIVVVLCAHTGAPRAALPDRLQEFNFIMQPVLCSADDMVAIDPKGRVAVNSAGTLDWEQEPLSDLMGSLLAEAPVQYASAQDDSMFDAQARQGAEPSQRTKHGPVGRPSQVSEANPQKPEEVTLPAESTPRLPFQGAPAAKPASGPKAAPERPAPTTGVDGARQHLVEPPPSGTGTEPKSHKKKPAVRRHAPSEGSTEAKPASVSAGTQNRAKPKRSGTGTTASTAGLPPTTSGTPPAASAGRKATGGLPALPPALPYTKSSDAKAAAPPMPASADGTVMARVPTSTPIPLNRGAAPATLQPAPLGVDAGKPLPQANPISGFIMDSFGQAGPAPVSPTPTQPTQTPDGPPQPQVQAAPPQTQVQARPPQAHGQPTSAAPANGLFGQLSNDVQQLGSGIRDVFQRIVPGGQ